LKSNPVQGEKAKENEGVRQLRETKKKKRRFSFARTVHKN